jgi:hypothetical protein
LSGWSVTCKNFLGRGSRDAVFRFAGKNSVGSGGTKLAPNAPPTCLTSTTVQAGGPAQPAVLSRAQMASTTAFERRNRTVRASIARKFNPGVEIVPKPFRRLTVPPARHRSAD